MKKILKFTFIISSLVMFSSANFALSSNHFVDCNIYPNDPVCTFDPFNPVVDCDIYPNDPVCTFDPFNSDPSNNSTNNFSSNPINVSDIGDFIFKIQQILNSIIPVLVALGVVYFVWGVVIYVIGDDEEAKKKGKDRMIYGIIGFAVIIALWGLVFIVVNTFFPDGVSAPSLAPSTGEDSTCTLINNPNPTFKNLLCYVTGIINDSVIPLIFALAVVVFVWGTINFFILNSDDEKKREQGRQFMIWGIVALAVMLSVWGLVEILGNTFGIDFVLPRVTPPP